LQLLKFRVYQSIGGYNWYRRLRGWEVDATEFEHKSYGQNYALKKPITDPEELAQLLMKLTEKMSRRLRRSGHAAGGVHVGCLYNDMTYWHQGRMNEQELYTTPELYRQEQLIFRQQPVRKVIVSLGVNCYFVSNPKVRTLRINNLSILILVVY
jgi:nucleotidyltransferase/DNA polymerase involved in DNA repair